MTDSRPIEADIRASGGSGDETDMADSPGEATRGDEADAGDRPDGAPVSGELFKEAFSHHAAGVAIVAIRDAGKVHATTVSSFIPVSPSPPRLLVSVGGNAQVLPFFDEGRRFVVNLLGAGQRKLAGVFADSFPVGPSPFPDTGEPEIPDALVSLRCRVDSLTDTGGGLLVLGRVEGARIRGGDGPLIHYRRGYHSVGEGGG